MERSVRSILNKLTMEKFEDLYQKLLLDTTGLVDYVEILACEIFRKATVQHTFTAMYADLCARLDADLDQSADGHGGMRFRSAILDQCRQLLQASWTPSAEGKGAEDADQEEEAEALRKRAALGNLRFIGEILVRGLLPPSELFTLAEDLRQTPVVPEKLEALCVLLTVVGPALDTQEWEHHDQLRIIFWDIRGLTFSPGVPMRMRCLLRDLLDLRDAGWVDAKAATQERGPKGPKQLRSTAASESSQSPKLRPRVEAAVQAAPPPPTAAEPMREADATAAAHCTDAGVAEGALPSSAMQSTQEAWFKVDAAATAHCAHAEAARAARRAVEARCAHEAWLETDAAAAMYCPHADAAEGAWLASDLDATQQVWLEADAAAAMYCADADVAQGAWPAPEGMDCSFDEAWGCGTYMVFMPMEAVSASWDEAGAPTEVEAGYA